MTLFLCGDVMTGRGIDQILEHPSTPELHEPYVTDAREYVALAEHAGGPVPRSAPASYVWGDALDELQRMAPAARIVNLETSLTRSNEYWQGKDIHYRMHPANVGCLTAARIDVCALANNHVLDFGRAGLEETLATLHAAGVKTAGAGRNRREARAPAIIEAGDGHRILVRSFGVTTSGIPTAWTAADDEAGLAVLDDLSDRTAAAVMAGIEEVKRSGDLVVASIHWGANWGYEIPRAHVRFAHQLIDGGVDLVHGHSSHHPLPIEVYRDRLILYGCGDFLNDYEGISGYEEYRDDLVLMYFPSLDRQTGALTALRMKPLHIRGFRLNRMSSSDLEWVRDTLDRVSRPFGSRVKLEADGSLRLIPLKS